MSNIDGQYHVQEEDICTICGDYLLGDDRPLTLVESGRMDPMKKDPSFLKFSPDWLNKSRAVVEDSLADVFHAECVIASAIDGDWGRFSPLQCDACEARFLKDIPRWAFRFRIGGVDLGGFFIADRNLANSAILCPECFKLQIGDFWEDEEEVG